MARNLVKVCDEVGLQYGIPVVNKRIAVSPIAVAACALPASQMVAVAHTLDDAARATDVDFIGGFGALVEKGLTPAITPSSRRSRKPWLKPGESVLP